MRTEADASASSDVSATLGTSYCTPFVPPAAEQGSEGIDGTAGEPVPESCQLVNHKNRLLIDRFKKLRHSGDAFFRLPRGREKGLGK